MCFLATWDWAVPELRPGARSVERELGGLFLSRLERRAEDTGAGDEGAVDHAADGDHGEAGVLEFAHLHALLVLRGHETHGVPAKVARHAPVVREHVQHRHLVLVERKLHRADEEDDVGPRARRDRDGRLNRTTLWASIPPQEREREERDCCSMI